MKFEPFSSFRAVERENLASGQLFSGLQHISSVQGLKQRWDKRVIFAGIGHKQKKPSQEMIAYRYIFHSSIKIDLIIFCCVYEHFSFASLFWGGGELKRVVRSFILCFTPWRIFKSHFPIASRNMFLTFIFFLEINE